MAEFDKDGRFAEALADRIACLGMSMNESLRESRARVERLLAEVRDTPEPDDG